jgi:hypothetical protein
MNAFLSSPLAMMAIILLIQVWLASKVGDWAKRRGRTSKAWFVCAAVALIPTIVILALLPKLPVITMQHSSLHKIDLSAIE